MNIKPILLKSGDFKSKTKKMGKLYRMMVKSDKMEAIIAELEPNVESRWYKHEGEELHLVLEGRIEYIVGEKSYNLSVGDILWHKSTTRHRVKNIYSDNAKYITIGTPPTFM